MTAHFSHPVTFGAQWGTVDACLVSLSCLVMKIYPGFQICGDVCHSTDLVIIGEIIVLGSRLAQSSEYSPCKRVVPESSFSLTAHFSHPMTYFRLSFFFKIIVRPGKKMLASTTGYEKTSIGR